MNNPIKFNTKITENTAIAQASGKDCRVAIEILSSKTTAVTLAEKSVELLTAQFYPFE